MTDIEIEARTYKSLYEKFLVEVKEVNDNFRVLQEAYIGLEADRDQWKKRALKAERK